MNRLYEWQIQIKERVQQTMKKIGAAGGRAYDKLERKNKAYERGLNRTNNKASQLLGNLKRFAGLTLASIGIGAMVTQTVNLAANMEQTRVSFETLLGSAEKGNRLLKDLNQFANVTPNTNQEVIQGGKVLLAAGFDDKQVVNELRKVGDVASASSVPLTELSSIYAKTMMKGKLQAEELNQMADRGIPINKALAKSAGVHEDQLRELAAKGKLTATNLQEAFTIMTSKGGVAYKQMEKQSKTFNGLKSTMIGKVQLLAVKYGTMLLPTFKRFVNLLIKGADWVMENQRTINTLAIAVTTGATAFALYNGYLAITKIQLAGATLQQKLLNIAMKANPVGLVITGITILAGVMAHFYQKNAKFREFIDGMWGALKGIGTIIKDFVIDQFNNLFQSIGKVGKAFQYLKKGQFGKAVKSVGEGLTGLSPAGQIKTAVETLNKNRNTVQVGYATGVAKSKIKTQRNNQAAENDLNTKSADTNLIPDILPEKEKNLTGATTTNNSQRSSSGGERNITVTIEKMVENITVSSGENFDLSKIRTEIEEQLVRAVRGAEVSLSNG